MMNLLNKRIPTTKFPQIIIHIYYFMISITFTYLYYHKFISKADFYSKINPGGLFAVANFESMDPFQFRILIPLIFKWISMLNLMPPKILFFIINAVLAYLILLSFYFLLGKHFKSKAMNCWLAPIIIYPMIWNLIILNGQFYYMDFGLLLSIIVGYYFIVTNRPNWLLLTFFIGLLNHTGVIFLPISYLLFNYKNIFKFKTIVYAAAMYIIFIGVFWILNMMLPQDRGGFIIVNNSMRNLSLFSILPAHIIIRDFLFNFGGLHFIVLIFIISGQWKKFKGPFLYINLMIIPFLASMLFTFSIEEMRNYSVIIPNVLIISLMFLSTFEKSFLRPLESVLPLGNSNENNDKN
jgi:hypothetical protein